MKDSWTWLLAGGAALVVLGGSVAEASPPPSSFGYLSMSDILSYAQAAGFNGQDLIIAGAVAMAESSGNPNAHGDLTKGQGSYGLWQIYSTAHPEFGPDFTRLYDPQTNAHAAFQIYAQAKYSFMPWTGTYPTGLYLPFMAAATAAAGGLA